MNLSVAFSSTLHRYKYFLTSEIPLFSPSILSFCSSRNAFDGALITDCVEAKV